MVQDKQSLVQGLQANTFGRDQQCEKLMQFLAQTKEELERSLDKE